ncbi:hypothetical protein H6G76_36280 [Nostoc sp. FACHB-152]|uniref:hypothetical protein n=1 Tax=unclassified Nostoc TaxID=2593658 RepID=UPI001688018A|nr:MULTISPECIES: hypothetical protein [unclassified Nostoc]MBD2452461.1 hypothetical protein [Nostoc sp. FACHB-152]MBD2473376.1 hypothetical protein [Nostoc sp. FACHB-145]
MSTIYQELLNQWANLAPDECSFTDRDYKFKVKILPTVEKRNSNNASRVVSSENIEWRLSTHEGQALEQLNFVLLTIINHCTTRQASIGFTFTELGITAVICNGLKSQPHPHAAMSSDKPQSVYAALDAYIQLLEF